MDRCPECPCEYDPVPPDRYTKSDYLLIGEKPGYDEDKQRKCFVGKTGREVNEGYLPMLGWSRSSKSVTVTATNAMKCYGGPGTKDKLDLKKQAHRDRLFSCARQHLYNEIKQTQPKLLIPMGVAACMALDPEIDLELQHGIPTMTSFGMAFPMYHPASGLHEPKKMLIIRSDWDRLRKYIKGKLYLPVDPYAGREDYRCLESAADVRKSLRGHEHLTLACDTEVKRHSRKNPFCITYSTEPGKAYLILADNKKGLSAFQDALNIWGGWILWHNWLFDCDVVANMDLEFPEKRIRDTMQLAYHLGNLPQGLKALANRELGMKMVDFDDVVTPHSRELCENYLRWVSTFSWPKPESHLERDEKTGLFKIKSPRGLNTKLKTFFTRYEKDPDNVDVFDAWDNWEEDHEMIQEKCGEWPSKCISHVPFDEALFYACRDADALGRLFPVMMRMRRRVRKTMQENWRDVA